MHFDALSAMSGTLFKVLLSFDFTLSTRQTLLLVVLKIILGTEGCRKTKGWW